MNQDTTTFNAPANTYGGRSLSSTENLRAVGSTLRLGARVAGVVLCGCFLLGLLFAIQVAALELSDRFNIFPLYGFFVINLICGLFLTWRIVKPRLSNQRVVPTTLATPGRSRRLWAGMLDVVSTTKANSKTQTTGKPVAVLLIIKRNARVESKEKSHAASA